MVEFQFLFLVAVYYEVVFIVAAQGSTNQTRLSKQQQRMDTLFDTLKCASNTQTIEQTLMKNQTQKIVMSNLSSLNQLYSTVRM